MNLNKDACIFFIMDIQQTIAFTYAKDFKMNHHIKWN